MSAGLGIQMKLENQRCEWKETWRDEYLKWLSGFANADGGLLVIGRDDAGAIVGLPNGQRLLVELPNKIRDALGILARVELCVADGKRYLEIEVEPHPNPISFRGEYYLRSGSTNQMLKGAALDAFLLRKHGRHWDGAPYPGVKAADLDPGALKAFRKSIQRSQRIADTVLDEPDATLLEKLRLVEGRYLTRAAILLFHAEPERYFAGASVKLGFFETDANLRYQDEVQGPLLAQAGRVVEILTSNSTLRVHHRPWT